MPGRNFVVLTLDLPWPPRQLNPNVRTHWGQQSRCSKKARKEGALLMHSELNRQDPIDPKKIDKVHIKYDFYPPDRRKRDDDNLIRCMKPYRDGIADALGVDDHCFRTCKPLIEETPSRPAHVDVTLMVEFKDE